MQHSRRDFMQLMGLLAIGLPIPTLSSCGLQKKISDPYEALLLMQEKIRQSADYLPARMADAIESKDPEKMFVFVRDSIQTYPNPVSRKMPSEKSGYFKTDNYRWGDEGCLRYGAGTCYEKAHLLKSMLQQAGFEASVKFGPFDIEKVGWERIFFIPAKQRFDASFPRAIDKESFQIRPWEAADLNNDQLEATFRQIMQSIPDDFTFIDPDWKKTMEMIDLVEFVQEGERIYLNPNIKDAQYGKSYLKAPQGHSKKHNRWKDVRLRLKMINSYEPYRPHTLVEGSIPIEKLFGNQVNIHFESHLSTLQQLTLPRNRNQAFIPTISLTGPKLSEADEASFVFGGKTIHINGNTLEADGDQLLINGHPIQKGQEHPALRKQVKNLEAKVWADAFPKIDIRLQAEDRSGRMIEGLEGPDFEIREDGIPIPFQLHPQKREGVKVLLLHDLSGSIPANFRDEGVEEFANSLMKAVQKEVPDAEFKVATFVGLIKYQFILSSEWSTDPMVIAQQLAEIKELWDHSSALWTALADASQQSGADLIVFVTDGNSHYDGNIAEKKRIIERGCPVITLGVGDKQNLSYLQEMAYHSGGISRSVEEHQEAIDFISAFSNDIAALPYRLSYYSSPSDRSEREVNIRVKDSSIEQTLYYTIPKKSSHHPPSWIGIHLEVELGRERVHRRLAGMPTHSRSPKRNPVLPHYREETAAALFGNYRLCIEGTEPTTAILLDEIIEAKLSQKQVMEAIQTGSNQDTLKALERGFYSYPEDYFQLQHTFAPSSGEDFFCFQNGLRATLFSHYPNKEGTLVKAVDILPFSQWRTIHADPKTSFEISLRHSLQLMNLEARNYDTATLNVIAGAPLDWTTHHEADQWLREQEDVAFYIRWKNALQQQHNQVHLLPGDRKKAAFYNLDTNSGTVFAQLMNGSGGGEQETRERFAALDRALTAFDQVFKRLGVGPAVGAWIGLEKKKMEYLMIATIAILTMDAQQANEDLNNTLRKHLCNHFEDAAAVAAGSLGDLYKDVLDFVGVATGQSLSVCG